MPLLGSWYRAGSVHDENNRGNRVAQAATEAVGQFGSRVSLVLKADIRPGYSGELTAKLNSLEESLGI